jgi:cysteinyl-tRNA synthetase
MLQLSGEKMSKSEGNLITVNELLGMGGAEIFRFMVLGSHYRSPLVHRPSVPAADPHRWFRPVDRRYCPPISGED